MEHRNGTVLVILLTLCLLILSSACGTLEVGIESTATSVKGDGETGEPGPATATAEATKAPIEVQPGEVFEFTAFVHPQWNYQLSIPNGAKVVHSPDGLSTAFAYEDTDLIRGAYNLSVDVVPEPGTDSSEELVQRLTTDGVDLSPVRMIEVDGGNLVGAAVSYMLPRGAMYCAELQVLNVAFVKDGTGYVLKISSDAPDRCDVQTLPETEGVIGSFRVPSSVATTQESPNPTTEEEPTPKPVETPDELWVAFVKDGNVWLWGEDVEATALTGAGGVSDVKISDDGEVVAFVRGDELWAVDRDGGNERQLIGASYFATVEPRESFESEVALNRFEWVPGTHILAFNTRLVLEIGLILNDDLHLVDADTLEQKLLLPAGEGGEFYYSPDGRQIAVVTAGSISLTDADGGNRRDVFTYTPVVTYSEVQFYARPAWAADSRSLRVVIPPADPLAQPAQPGTVWNIAIDQPLARLLGNIMAAPGSSFAFSPDLTYVVYLALAEGALPGEAGVLSVTDLRDGEMITYYPQSQSIYGWAPDSQHFAFMINLQAPQALIGALGANAERVQSDVTIATIDVTWVSANRYLYLSRSSRGWDIYLGQLDGSRAFVAAVEGAPPPFDFAHPGSSVESGGLQPTDTPETEAPPQG